MEFQTIADDANLPEPVRELFAEDRPLPPGVQFFEQSFTLSALLKRSLIGVGLAVASALLLLLGVTILFDFSSYTGRTGHDGTWWLIGIGATFGLAAWMMLASLPQWYRRSVRQSSGQQTRYGLFITLESLVFHGDFSTEILPRERFAGVVGRTVYYLREGEKKTLLLPTEWVRISPADLPPAIVAWAAATQPGQSPAP